MSGIMMLAADSLLPAGCGGPNGAFVFCCFLQMLAQIGECELTSWAPSCFGVEVLMREAADGGEWHCHEHEGAVVGLQH